MKSQTSSLMKGSAVLLVAALFLAAASAQTPAPGDYIGSTALPDPATTSPSITALATSRTRIAQAQRGCCEISFDHTSRKTKCFDTNQVDVGAFVCNLVNWYDCLGATWSLTNYICGADGICAPPGGNGDPHFVGFDGTKYDFHGHAGQTYALISEPSHQVNSLFIPSNPDDTIQPGTYMGTISVMVSKDMHLALEVKGYRYMLVTVNGKVHELSGESMDMVETFGPVTLKTEHRYEEVVNAAVVSKATIETPLFRFVVWASSGNKYNNGTAISSDPVDNLHETPYLAFSVSILQKLPGGSQSLHGLVGQSLPWILEPSSSADLQSDEVVDKDYFPRPSSTQAFEAYLKTIEDWFLVENIWASECKINRFAQKSVFEAAPAPLKKINLPTARRSLAEAEGVSYPLTAGAN